MDSRAPAPLPRRARQHPKRHQGRPRRGNEPRERVPAAQPQGRRAVRRRLGSRTRKSQSSRPVTLAFRAG